MRSRRLTKGISGHDVPLPFSLPLLFSAPARLALPLQGLRDGPGAALQPEVELDVERRELLGLVRPPLRQRLDPLDL